MPRNRHKKPSNLNLLEKLAYNEEIMNALLSEKGVVEKVARMTEKELDFFKRLLMKQGTYQRYAIEYQKKQMKEIKESLKVN